MNYPEHIYRKFEIIEKDILGEKHYAAVQVREYLFGLIKFKKLKLITSFDTFTDWSYGGTTWHSSKRVVDEAIKKAKEDDEVTYYHEMVK